MTQHEQAVAAVAAVRALLARVGELPGESHEELTRLLSTSADLARSVGSLQVRLAGEIARRSEGSADQSMCRLLGHRSAKEAVAAAFGIRAREAESMLSMAALTSAGVASTGEESPARFPKVAEAIDGGELSLTQAQAIVQQLEPAVPHADVADLALAEASLVDAATDVEAPLAPERLVSQARELAEVLDPGSVLPDAERQRALRSLRIWQRPGGGWHIAGDATEEDGAKLKAFLDAFGSPRVRPTFRDDDEPAQPDDAVVDDRTREQRQYDVLMAAITAQAAAADTPVAGGEPPTLVLTGTIEAFDAYVRGVDHPDRTLTIEHTGGTVPIEWASRFACDSVILHAVVNAAGLPLSLGRTERLFSRAQRRALAIRDKGCRVIGCGMPVAWCEAHHVTPWSLGGPTDVDHGILVCNYHHHEIHAGRLIVEKAGIEPGSWRIVRAPRPAGGSARGARPRSDTLACAVASDQAVKLPDRPTATRHPRRHSSPIAARLRRRLGSAPPPQRPCTISLFPPRIVLRT